MAPRETVRHTTLGSSGFHGHSWSWSGLLGSSWRSNHPCWLPPDSPHLAAIRRDGESLLPRCGVFHDVPFHMARCHEGICDSDDRRGLRQNLLPQRSTDRLQPSYHTRSDLYAPPGDDGGRRRRLLLDAQISALVSATHFLLLTFRPSRPSWRGCHGEVPVPSPMLPPPAYSRKNNSIFGSSEWKLNFPIVCPLCGVELEANPGSLEIFRHRSRSANKQTLPGPQPGRLK